jgi:hypothetical protein
VSYKKDTEVAYTSWILGFPPGLLLGSGCSSLYFSVLCCVCFCPVSCVPKSLCYLIGNFHKFYIHLCMQLEQNVKNSCNLLQGQSYIRTKCFSIFTRPTWTNYISPLSRRETYCLSRIVLLYHAFCWLYKVLKT